MYYNICVHVYNNYKTHNKYQINIIMVLQLHTLYTSIPIKNHTIIQNACTANKLYTKCVPTKP